MNIRNISGIVVFIIGVCLYFFANYIADEVQKGKGQIAEGQQKVDQVEDVTALSPYTKDIGGMIAKSGQKKIDEGQKQVDEYENLANNLHLSGIVLAVGGIGLILISFIHKKKQLH